MFTDAFGQQQGLKVQAASDPEVLKALELLPQASALEKTAKEVIASRMSPAGR